MRSRKAQVGSPKAQGAAQGVAQGVAQGQAQGGVARRKARVASVAMVAIFALMTCAGLWARGRGGIASFPAQQRDPDPPEVIARGRAIYDTDCRSCHGPDLRGGERGGPNLLRSAVMLNDRNGEMLEPVLRGSHKDRVSPNLTSE